MERVIQLFTQPSNTFETGVCCYIQSCYENVSSCSKSEAKASELLESHENVFPGYYMHTLMALAERVNPFFSPDNTLLCDWKFKPG